MIMADIVLGPPEIKPKKQKLSPSICYDEVYNLYDLATELNTEEKAVEFCKSWGLLPKSALCPKCGRVLTNYQTEHRPSDVKPFLYHFECTTFRCSKSGRNRVEVTKNTFFERAKISLRKYVVLIYLFSRKSSVETAVWETSGRSFYNQTTSHETVYDVYSHCRQVCLESFYNRDGVYNKIGGINCTVEIYGAKFKFEKKSKHIDDEKVEVQEHWAIGGICRETNDCFFVPVEERTEDKLIATIIERVERGTTIVSDCCTSSVLEENGYKHVMINENHVDPTGGGIHLIESTWLLIKRALEKPSQLQKHFDLGAHLAEYLWRRKHHKDKENLFARLLRDIAKVFPGPEGSTLSLQSTVDSLLDTVDSPQGLVSTLRLPSTVDSPQEIVSTLS